MTACLYLHEAARFMTFKSDTLLLADVLKNFRKMCLIICYLDPVKYLSASRLAWQAALKKTEVKLKLLADIDMLLMIKKGIRGRICYAIHMQKLIINI